MERIWEFFENLDEMVYVSDIETNQLIYMNAHLRNSLGFRSHEDYIGKKCHAVLQGQDTPCAFCTNDALQEKCFVSWVHKNPILDKKFLIKDTLIPYGNKHYRLELAIDVDSSVIPSSPYYYTRSETVLNKCLQQIVSTLQPEEAIQKLLAYLGKTFLCDRCYIFEIAESDLMSNTYEWCAAGVQAQKEILQRDSTSVIDWWMEHFQENKVVVIEDLEEIRTQYPSTYAALKPQNISRLVVGPIRAEDHVMGFVGVDNPNEDMVPLISSLLSILGFFIVSLLRRRDLLNRLNNMSFHDSLTGAFNRNAMSEHQENYAQLDSMGVIYCDITGLKRTNDSLGHDAGDRMIQYCYGMIHDALCTELIYRTGGDEFVAVCTDCSEEEFMTAVQRLRSQVRQDIHHIAVGYAWSNCRPLNLEAMISEADKVMYQDKREYYENHVVPGRDRRRAAAYMYRTEDDADNSVFRQFLADNYHDVESMFLSIVQHNTTSYFYLGDMEKNLFYISDNMRDDFGFVSNVVPDMLGSWEQHISTPKMQALYRQELRDMLEKKRTVHNLRYQVRNAHGKNIWVHCYGIMKWNEDKSAPLFFSGRITYQDADFVVDPVTNLPRASSVRSHLYELENNQERSLVIGFSFNNITEINNTRGRAFADHLLKNIAETLMEQLSDRMAFYRLEGMRCMAMVNPEYSDNVQECVDAIRRIIGECYEVMGISVQRPCSFGVMWFPYPSLSKENFVEHIVSLVKVAKYDLKHDYVEYTTDSIQQIQDMSRMSLALCQDVLCGMEHFRIVIQPVVSTEDERVIGGEVLLRWSFEGEDISPAVFIPMLEKKDMIHLAGRWVFEQAARNCVRILPYIPEFYLTFNVSLRQLSDTQFLEIMRSSMEKYHLDGHHMVVEMTESCMDEHPEVLAYFLEQCNAMGVRIALDDFGSGYSSLQMLLRYPYDLVKLDSSLIREISSDQKLQFIRSIVYACHQFGKKVCMEGVETEAQKELIRESGCDVIQGYYYYRPMELEDFYSILGGEQ